MLTSLLLTLSLSAATGHAVTAADRECPTLVHPEYALARRPLVTRLIANAAAYGIIYVTYGVEYLAAVVTRGAPPPRTNLYQRPAYVEMRRLCPGDPVLLDGQPGRVVGLTGRDFPRDPDLRAVLGVPLDATNYVAEAGAYVAVAIRNAKEVAAADRVAVAADTLTLPPLTANGEDGEVRAGDVVSDCAGTGGAFRRVFARPGQIVTHPQDQVAEFGARGELIPVRDLCVEVPKSRQVDVELRGYADEAHRRGQVIRFRGFDQIDVRFADGQTDTVSRKKILR